MSLPENLAKGDPLLLVSAGRNVKAEEVVVSRVGRVWVYVTRKGSAHEYDGQFDRTTGVSKVNVGWSRRLVTPEQYAEMQERERLLADLKEAGVEIQHKHQGTISIKKLKKLLVVMVTEETPSTACSECGHTGPYPEGNGRCGAILNVFVDSIQRCSCACTEAAS